MLGPLLYCGLSAARDARAAAFLPDYRQALTANRYRLSHAVAAREALEGAGLRPVLLKGGAFVQRFATATAGVRPMSDLDVLVGPGEFAEAGRVLAGLGFEAVRVDRFPVSHRAAPARSFLKAHGGSSVEIDLHRAVGQWPVGTALLRVVRDTAERAGGWLVPSLPAAFCLAALHRARHGYLLSCMDLLDVARATTAMDEREWAETVDVAARCAATGAAYAALRQACWWFGGGDVERARLESLRARIGRARRELLNRMAPLEGPLAAVPFWNRPLVRNLVVIPCATGTPGRALVAMSTFLPLRAADEWVLARQRIGGPLAGARQVWKHVVWGADPGGAVRDSREARQ